MSGGLAAAYGCAATVDLKEIENSFFEFAINGCQCGAAVGKLLLVEIEMVDRPSGIGLKNLSVSNPTAHLLEFLAAQTIMGSAEGAVDRHAKAFSAGQQHRI